MNFSFIHNNIGTNENAVLTRSLEETRGQQQTGDDDLKQCKVMSNVTLKNEKGVGHPDNGEG